MPVKKSKSVVPANGGKQVAAVNWRERAALSIVNSRKVLAKLPASGGNFVSLRGGQITLGGNVLANPLPMVILSHGYERAWYSKPFSPDVMAVPDCYSFDDIEPHEKSAIPQAERCSACRWSQFGSAANQKGKACREGARIAFIHADHAGSPAQVAAAPIMQVKLSVLNSKGFRLYAENVFDAEGRPTWTSVSRMTCVPDAGTQYATSFAPDEFDEPDDALLDALAARIDEADKLLIQPYAEIEQPAPPPVARPGQAVRRKKF